MIADFVKKDGKAYGAPTTVYRVTDPAHDIGPDPYRYKQKKNVGLL